jgi:hypothetical protein
MAERIPLRYLPEGCEVQTWDQLIKIYREFFRGSEKADGARWIFRGEGEVHDRALRPVLERTIEKYGATEDSGDLKERLLREFQRKAHHYLATVPKRDDTLEWLALMRHYGAPTRLLDWTYSFFVAVYFACQDARKDTPCVVYALDTTRCLVEAKHRLRWVLGLSRQQIEDPGYDALYVDGSLESRRRFERTMMRRHRRNALIYPVNPFRLNRRLVIQQGVFTCPGDVSKGFFENLAGMPKTEVLAVRIAGGEMVRECLTELRRMNMSRAVLFPGLGGFASSLVTRLASPDTLGKRQRMDRSRSTRRRLR